MLASKQMKETEDLHEHMHTERLVEQQVLHIYNIIISYNIIS